VAVEVILQGPISFAPSVTACLASHPPHRDRDVSSPAIPPSACGETPPYSGNHPLAGWSISDQNFGVHDFPSGPADRMVSFARTPACRTQWLPLASCKVRYGATLGRTGETASADNDSPRSSCKSRFYARLKFLARQIGATHRICSSGVISGSTCESPRRVGRASPVQPDRAVMPRER